MRAPPFSTSHLPRDLHSKQQLELEQNANPPLPWRRASGQRGFIGVPSIEEVFEGCQDSSELSWELCEAFLSTGNNSECGFLCLSSFLPDRHWELKCPKLWRPMENFLLTK